MLTPFHSFKHKDGLPLVPGQIAELKFGLLTTSTLVRKGHRLRVAIAGADKDTFVRVPAEGFTQISVERNAQHPSSIRIPLVPRSNQPQMDPWRNVWTNLGAKENAISSLPAGATSLVEAAVPTVDQIIDRYVLASGGRDAIARTTTRVAKGFRVYSNGTNDLFENSSAHPDKIFSIRRFPFGTLLTGSIGQDAWIKVNDEPVQLVKDTNPEKGNTPQYILQTALHMHELYVNLKLKGVETIHGRSAYIIDAVNVDGDLARLCFDVSTGLLLCTMQKQKVQNLSSGKDGWTGQKVLVDVETYYDDYRNVDGVMVAFMINTTVPSGLTTTIYTEVKDNLALDEAIFKRPQ
jgi:hypothetical protein